MIFYNTIYVNILTGVCVKATHEAGCKVVKLLVVDNNGVPYLSIGSKITTSYNYFTKVYVVK